MRAVHRIVGEPADGGYVSRRREGRRNPYKVKRNLPVRGPLLLDRTLADLLELFAGSDGREHVSRRGEQAGLST